MSRIGKKPLLIPKQIKVEVLGRLVTVKGPNAEMEFKLPCGVNVSIEENQILVVPENNNRQSRQNWGMVRTQISNLIIGVTTGFTEYLDIIGVGYRAQIQGKTLKLSLGYSHDVDYIVPDGVTIKTPKPTEIEIFGACRQKVGQVAAEIMAWRPSEPYKGKGVNLRGNYIFRKEGKKK